MESEPDRRAGTVLKTVGTREGLGIETARFLPFKVDYEKRILPIY